MWKLKRVQDYFGSHEIPKPDRVFVSPDLCQYGMKEPGREDLFWKKRITLAATYPELCLLEIQCAKSSEDREHQHVHVRGNVKTPEGWKSRATLSAR